MANSMCPALADEAIFGEAKSEFVKPIVTEETIANEVVEWDFRTSSDFVRSAGEIAAVAVGPQACRPAVPSALPGEQ